MITSRDVLRRRKVVLSAAAGIALAAFAAPASADRAWDRGGGDAFWTTPANWNPDGVPTSADNVTFTDTGAGTVDLNNTTQPGGGSLPSLNFNNATTGYLIQNGAINFAALNHNAGAAVSNTISAQLNSTGPWNINSGTLVLSNGNNAISGPVTIASGAKLDVMAPSSSGIGNVSIAGGTLTVRGGLTTTSNALFDRIYYRTGTPGDLNPISNLINAAPSLTRTVTFPITYDLARVGVAGNDAQNGNNGQYSTVALGALRGGNQNNIEVLTTGKLTLAADGTLTLGTRSDDGSIIYVDKNNDGLFDPATEKVVDNNRDQGYTNATANVSLTAGTYNIAIGYYQGGCCDNNGLEVRYGLSGGLAYNDAAMRVLDPSNPIAGSTFSFDVFNPANLSASALTVTAANSVVDIQSTTGTIGNVTFNAGTSLTLQGLAAATVTTGSLSGAGAATLNTSIPTTAGALGGFTTFTKGGASSLTLGTDAPAFAGGVVVAAGSLVVTSAGALGTTAGNTTVNSGGQLSLRADGIAEPVTLNGTGTANNGALEATGDGNNRAFAGPVTLGSDAYIVSSTAGKALTLSGGINTGGFQARIGGAGDTVVNTVGITGGGGIRHTEAGALTLAAASSYGGVTQVDAGILNINAALTGTPTVNSAGGVTNLNAGGSLPAATAINVSGGTFNANAPVAAATVVNTTAGTFNANAAGALSGSNNVSTSGLLRVTTVTGAGGPVAVGSGGRLQFDGGTNTSGFTTPSNNVTVNGGTVHARTGVADLATQNIVITASGLTAGLFQTQLAGAFNEGAFTPSGTLVQGTPKAQTNDNAQFPNDTTFVYSGKIQVPNSNGDGTGLVAFGESFDDNVLVRVDGVQQLRNTAYNVTTQKTLTLSAGLHDVEFRFGQGGGGVGPVTDNVNKFGPGAGNNGLGFGIYFPASSPADPGLDGTKYVDPATANAFFIQSGGGTVQVDQGAELRARTVTGATTTALSGTLTLSAGTAGSPLNSNTVGLNATGALAVANVGANQTLTAQTLSVATATTLTKTGAGTLAVSGATGVSLDNSKIVANAGLTDMSNLVVTAVPRATQAGIQGRLYVNTQLDPRNNAGGVNTLLGSAATNTKILTAANGPNGGLDFRSDDDLGNFFGNTAINGGSGNANYTVAFFGNYTAQATGTHLFGFEQQDDNSAIFVDANQNGTFEAGEQVFQRGCCLQNPPNADFGSGNVDLTAGQTYAIAIINEETGGGSDLGSKFQEPAGGANSTVPVVIAPGAAGQNQFTFSTGGGTLQVDPGATLAVGGTAGPVDATVNGTLRYAAKGVASTSQLGTVTVATGSTGTMDVQANQNVSITSGLTLNGNLVKTGTGRLAVNAVGTGTGSVSVIGGTLGGTGTITGPVSVASAGIVAPGNSVGTLGTGDFSITGAGATLGIELDPTNAGGLGTADNLNVTGTVTLTGGNLAVTLLSPLTTAGQQFQIVTNDGADPVAGTFATANGAPIAGNTFTTGGGTFSINYAGGTGNDVVLTLTAVPEPASLGVLGLGAGFLLARRRNRRAGAPVAAR